MDPPPSDGVFAGNLGGLGGHGDSCDGVWHFGKCFKRFPMNVILYTRGGCHLCDDAWQTLVEHGLAPQSVDIDADPKLVERFDTCVPVVEIDGKIRFRGRVDPVLLKRLISAENPL